MLQEKFFLWRRARASLCACCTRPNKHNHAVTAVRHRPFCSIPGETGRYQARISRYTYPCSLQHSSRPLVPSPGGGQRREAGVALDRLNECAAVTVLSHTSDVQGTLSGRKSVAFGAARLWELTSVASSTLDEGLHREEARIRRTKQSLCEAQKKKGCFPDNS